MRRPEAYGAKLSITSSCSMSFHWCDAWRAYARYDNEDRPHMSLGCDAPARRVVEPADKRNVVARLDSVDSTIAILGAPHERRCVLHHSLVNPRDETTMASDSLNDAPHFRILRRRVEFEHASRSVQELSASLQKHREIMPFLWCATTCDRRWRSCVRDARSRMVRRCRRGRFA